MSEGRVNCNCDEENSEDHFLDEVIDLPDEIHSPENNDWKQQ